MNFGEKLRMLRNEKKLSQKEVAEKLGISLRAYASYELNQRRPRTQDKLKVIADFFGKTVEYLQIDDLEQKIEAIERDRIEEIQYHSTLEKDVFDCIVPFLKNLGWKIECPKSGFDLTATLNSTRILFEVAPPMQLTRGHLNIINKYGYLCMLPPEQYTETYYIYISISKEEVTYIKKRPPINLTIPVYFYLFNAATKEFYSNELFLFISKLSQKKQPR